MNIIIPNADFSAVAVGKVDLNLSKVGDYNVYAAIGFMRFYEGQYATIFDVTGCSQVYIKAVGRNAAGNQYKRPHCIFFDSFPESNLTNNDEATAFHTHKISDLIDESQPESTDYYFEGIVSVPAGAKCVMLQYLTNANYEKVCVKES